jgi:hypothetical protein
LVTDRGPGTSSPVGFGALHQMVKPPRHFFLVNSGIRQSGGGGGAGLPVAGALLGLIWPIIAWTQQIRGTRLTQQCQQRLPSLVCKGNRELASPGEPTNWLAQGSSQTSAKTLLAQKLSPATVPPVSAKLHKNEQRNPILSLFMSNTFFFSQLWPIDLFATNNFRHHARE